MASIDQVIVNVANIQQAILNWKNAGFNVFPGNVSDDTPIQTAFIPFADYSYISLICIKQKINPIYTSWASNREGIVDYAVLTLDASATTRMLADANAANVSYAGPTQIVGNVNAWAVAAKSPFPILMQDAGKRGDRGVPFGPEFLTHPNGARGIKVVLVAAANPTAAAGVLAKMIAVPTSREQVAVGQATVKFLPPKTGEVSVDILTDKTPKSIDLKTLNYARVNLVSAMGYDASQAAGAPTTLPATPTAGAFFFPSEDSFAKLLDFINAAKKTLDIAIFNFSDNQLSRAVVAAKTRGVAVRLIADAEQTKNPGNDIAKLSQSGIAVRADTSPYMMHNKFALVDAAWLETGSYNWTASARTQNRENIVITSDVGLVAAFRAEFDKMWASFPEFRG